MNYKKIGFIGFGLIGGSIARRIRLSYPDIFILAYDSLSHNNLITAINEGILSQCTNNLDDFCDIDLIFLCAPTSVNIDYLFKLKSIIKPSCIISDVGSVKKDILRIANQLDMSNCFIGGHPMAGSEASGYASSSLSLLENAYYIICANKLIDSKVLNNFVNFVKELSFIPIMIEPVKHDEYVAAVSHVPHLIAFSLVNLVKNNDSDSIMKQIAAGGFKDITRIASSSPDMWRNICESNKDCILDYLHRFNIELSSIISCISSSNYDNLYSIFDSAKEYRDSINVSDNGIIEPIYDIYIDIIDEPGAIASIASILARKAISIKNIEIIHNREYTNGALKVEFNNHHAMECAIRILQACDYTICNIKQ